MRVVICAVMVVGLAGCGEEFPLVPVSGRVLVGGKPVANLRVSFAPMGTPQQPIAGPGSLGVTDADGKFTLTAIHNGRAGAVVGMTRVRIQVGEEGGNQTPDQDTPQKALRQRRLPQRYNDETTLTFEVPPGGTTEANFDLDWK